MLDYLYRGGAGLSSAVIAGNIRNHVKSLFAEVDYNSTMNLKPTIIRIAAVPVFVAAMMLFQAGTALGVIDASVAVVGTAVSINPNPQYAAGLPAPMQCLVCHGDPQLKDDKVLKSLYFGRDEVSKSAHLGIGCAACHSNYYEPPAAAHEEISKRDNKIFTVIAHGSCVKCHDHADEVAAVKASAHGGTPTVDATSNQPTCLDCHSFHSMSVAKKDPTWVQNKHMSSQEVCGKCHAVEWASYNDYYHGRAYKAGDVRAPSCWDCHTDHNQRYSDEKESSVSNKKNLKKTCGKCHKNVDDTFISYAPLIHQHQSLLKKNPLVVWFLNIVKKLLPKPALKVES